MALISQIPIADVAAATARALESLLGHDVVLATGTPELGDPADDILPEETTRTIVLPFSDGVVGELTLIVGGPFAMAMEAATPDASLTSAALPALIGGASAIALTIHIGVNPDGAGEIATETLLTSAVGEFAAVPLFENETRVACLVVRIVEDAQVTATAGAAGAMTGPSFELARLPDEPHHTGIAPHEIQPLGDGSAGAGLARPLSLLNDVNMEVTAELGRRRLKVRDLVGLQPGSVIELDRAAGSPVDVLVNGALVWHGEVVVVDDEFGIRVSEIVVDEN